MFLMRVYLYRVKIRSKDIIRYHKEIIMTYIEETPHISLSVRKDWIKMVKIIAIELFYVKVLHLTDMIGIATQTSQSGEFDVVINKYMQEIAQMDTFTKSHGLPQFIPDLDKMLEPFSERILDPENHPKTLFEILEDHPTAKGYLDCFTVKQLFEQYEWYLSKIKESS